MAKLLLIVPKMFAKSDLLNMDPEIPGDYEEKRMEFWSYVRDRLKAVPRVDKIYYDSLTEFEDPSKFVREDNEDCSALVSELEKAGAKLLVTEDKLSVSETQAWAKDAVKGGENTSLFELLAQSIEDRNKKLAQRISGELAEGETAVLFLSPSRKLGGFFEGTGVRVVTMQPFDPIDYVNSWLVTLQLRRAKNPPSDKAS